VVIDAIHVEVRDGQVAQRSFYAAVNVTVENKLVSSTACVIHSAT
jgi:hypothetical protein